MSIVALINQKKAIKFIELVVFLPIYHYFSTRMHAIIAITIASPKIFRYFASFM